MCRREPTHRPIRAVAIAALAIVVMLACYRELRAQNAETRDDGNWSATETQVWIVGVEITSVGVAQNVSVAFPIPQDWPEQGVTLLDQQVSNRVGRVKIESLPPGAKVASARIAQISPDEPARITLEFQIERRHHAVPSSQEQFRFFQDPPPGTAQFLRPSPYIESNHVRIRELAERIPIDEQDSAWRQTETVYDWLREQFPYQFDPEIKTCLQAMEQGHGDCEELSSLFIAVCRSRGIPARAVWVVDHTYPEFLLQDAAGQSQWIPVQMAGSRLFGEMIESRPILQKGDNFRMPGSQQNTRYAQPTLVARDASAGLSLQFFCRPKE
ncbi:MAG TPA: transglutaminase-like domain-containing protein [Pirellulaceae bacterium]|nr:transglutaminase-like domain-containing protein [Pirellulaceae bacterium]